MEFADRPESVVVPSDLIILLETLYVRLDGALALISGRSIDSVDSLLSLPFIPIAGGHGAEWRLNGSVHSSVLTSEEFTHAVMLLTNFAKVEGLLFENKSHSFAVHFRQKPEQKK